MLHREKTVVIAGHCSAACQHSPPAIHEIKYKAQQQLDIAAYHQEERRALITFAKGLFAAHAAKTFNNGQQCEQQY